MKTTSKAFNPILDTDIIAYRIIQHFKRCVEKDEWFVKSTDEEKIMILINDTDVYEAIPVVINSLRQSGYNVEHKETYFGGPIPMAISYYPTQKL